MRVCIVAYCFVYVVTGFYLFFTDLYSVQFELLFIDRCRVTGGAQPARVLDPQPLPLCTLTLPPANVMVLEIKKKLH